MRLWQYIYKPVLKNFSSLEKESIQDVWVSPAKRIKSLVNETNFSFLGSQENYIELGWKSKTKEILWLYNLHYFDYLNSHDSNQRKPFHKDIISHWIENNNDLSGIGFHPYPTSLRIVNWIKWDLSTNQATEDMIASISKQSRWLSKNIEWHILGNHLFTNAKALIFAGIYLKGPEAEIWFKKGIKIVKKEINNQILQDGGNFELSPMYHSIFYEDILDLINIFRTYPKKATHEMNNSLEICAKKMGFWLDTMLHPDDEISFFNDAAFNIAPSPAELKKYTHRLGLKSLQSKKRVDFNYIHLADSGYIKINSTDLSAILDCAKIGPDHLPSHAHADTLSFELSLFQKRLIVNGGTSKYGDDYKRNLERSTSSHSTVEINNRSSSKVWGGFRVANRAYPFDLQINESKNSIFVGCSHNGYSNLRNKLIHRREWDFKINSFKVKDIIFGKYNNAISRFIIHPDWKIKLVSNHLAEISLSPDKIINFESENIITKLSFTKFSPEFGKSYNANTIEIKIPRKENQVSFTWQPIKK